MPFQTGSLSSAEGQL